MYGITTEAAYEVLAKNGVEATELEPFGRSSELEVRKWVADRLEGKSYEERNEFFNAANLLRFELYGYHGGCTVLEG